jgi:hypothetical protein
MCVLRHRKTWNCWKLIEEIKRKTLRLRCDDLWSVWRGFGLAGVFWSWRTLIAVEVWVWEDWQRQRQREDLWVKVDLSLEVCGESWLNLEASWDHATLQFPLAKRHHHHNLVNRMHWVLWPLHILSPPFRGFHRHATMSLAAEIFHGRENKTFKNSKINSCVRRW